MPPVRLRPCAASFRAVVLVLLSLFVSFSALRAQIGDIGGSEPPTVVLSPSASTTSGGAATTSVSVTVEACDDGALGGFALDLTLDGQAVAYASAGTATTGCTGVGRRVWTATVTLTPGTHTLRAEVCDEQFPPACTPRTASYTYTQLGSGGGSGPQVAVSPDGGSVEAASGHYATQLFTVENTGTGTEPVAFSISCASPLTECKLTHGSVTLAPGEQVQVGVTHRPGSPGTTGRMTLTATQADGSGGQVSDAGTLDITGRALTWTYATEADLQGATVENSLCLTIAAGPGAAYECGRLRVAHALPGVRLLNRARAPTLLYNSDHAHPQPVVSMRVTPPAASGTPDEVKLTVTQTAGPAGSTLTGTRTFPGWAAGAWRKIALDVDGEALQTGIYSYTLTAEARYGSTWQTVQQTSGRLAVVNRVDSPFGRGWWLAGLEALITPAPSAQEILWVGGDGSTRVYQRVRTNVWGAETEPFRPDTLRRLSTGEYVRELPGGAQVVFGSGGKHIRTADRLGRTTSFEYSSGRLWRIRPAAPLALIDPLNYEFVYGATYQGTPRLSQVRVPRVQTSGDRDVYVSYSGNRMTIEDPGSPRTTVHYDYSTVEAGRIVQRTDRRGGIVYYDYREGGFLKSSVRYGGGSVRNADDVILRYVPQEWRGLTAPTTSTYSYVNGPRPDPVGERDYTLFWVDRFGAPYRIRDAWAYNQSTSAYDTWIYRQEARFPGLVTMTRTSTGTVGSHLYRYQTATYDAHGHLVATTDRSTRAADGRYATTLYAWDEAADAVSTIVAPEGEVTRMGYDGYGRRLWQQVGDDASRRATFEYYDLDHTYAAGALWKIADPVGDLTTFTYNARGNLSAVSPSATAPVIYEDDRIGRVTEVRTPIERLADGSLTHQIVATGYDLASRVEWTETRGPAMNNVPAQTLRIENQYDDEGNLLSGTRRVSQGDGANPTNLQPLVTEWRYDPLGRLQAKEVPHTRPGGTVVMVKDSIVYNAAGNDTLRITRRGDTIRSRYDVLNRLVGRTTSAVSYDSTSIMIPRTYEGNAATVQPWCESVGGVGDSGMMNHVYPRHPNAAHCGYEVPGDSASFGYDIAGNLIRADNAYARLRRAFDAARRLVSDTLRIRTLADLSSGGNFDQHEYVLGYEYDLNGRRKVMHHPTAPISEIAPVANATTRYTYDPITGALSTVTDPLGNVFEYVYDLTGALDEVRSEGGSVRGYDYDGAGRLSSYQVSTPSEGVLDNSTFGYDLRGKQTLRTNSVLGERYESRYSGLGHLIYSGFEADFTNQFGARILDSEQSTFSYDALGNVYATDAQTSNESTLDRNYDGTLLHVRDYRLGGSQSDAGYDPATGQMLWQQRSSSSTPYTDEYTYDEAGNLIAQVRPFSDHSGTGDVNPHDRYSYYGADGGLAAVDMRHASILEGSNRTEVINFEEYRYDALGRRIWVYSRNWCDEDPTTSAQSVCADSYSSLRRIIWDGDQELYEIRAPAGAGVTTAQMEADVQPPAYASTAQSDPNVFFGRVLYTRGLAIDQPLSVTRMDYADEPNGTTHGYHRWPAFTVIPLWDTNGKAPYATFSNGTRRYCTMAPGEPARCLDLYWLVGWRPYAAASSAYIMNGDQQALDMIWMGSLLEDKQDASGLLYRRNRYYDPSTGRFTQEDPIGFAGGLNLYGFAAGDPVSYRDPYGLIPCSELRANIDAIADGIRNRIRLYMQHYRAGDADTGHMEQITGRKGELDRQMRRYYRQEKCHEKDKDDHDDWPGSGAAESLAATIANLPPPQLDQTHGWNGFAVASDAANWVAPQFQVQSTVPDGTGILVGVGVGYFVYRGLRMVPSVGVPALWPTIPLNVATF